MFSFYLKSATRSLYRKRFFSLLNIAGLATGIAIFFLGLEFYQYEHGFNAFHPELDHLYRVIVETPEGKTGASFPALAPTLERQLPEIRRAIRFGDNFNDGAVVAFQPPGGIPLRSFRESGCVFVDPAFPDAFHFPLLEGRNQLDQPNTVLLTASAAHRLFGHQEALGQVIRLHNQFGELTLTVTGVLADIPDQSDIQFSYLLPIRTLDDPKYTEGADWAKTTTWGNDAYTTYLWLRPQANPENVARQATALWRKYDADYPNKKGNIRLQAMATMHLGTGWSDRNPTFASSALTQTVLLLSVLILVIAWVNYINFATADALTRAREIGIHKVTGSSRWQIILRAETESLLLTGISLAAALPLAEWIQGLFNFVTQRPLSLHYINDPKSWIVISAILGSGLLSAGAYTGFILSGLKPITALRFNTPGGGRHTLLRKGLITAQLIITCIFIAITLVAWQQIGFMKRHDLGMNIDPLVAIQGPSLRDSSFRSRSIAFRNQVAALPFVQRFTGSGSIPGVGSGHNFSSSGITGAQHRPGDDHIEYSISEVDEHFFPTYEIPLVTGQNFTGENAALGYKGDVLIINEKAARDLGYDPGAAAGAVVHWDKTYRILGVVRDYHHRSLKDPIEPILYVPQHNNACYTVRIDPSGLAQKMKTIQRLYEATYPGNTFTWFPLRDAYNRQYADQERTGIIAVGLSLVVILISGLGLVGLAAFTARRRTKEMGIRKVLGASASSLFVLLSSEYLWLVLAALTIATPVSWIISHRWLEGFAYRLQPQWWVWAATGGLCVLITLLTVSFHALRTAFINVVEQLRIE